MTPAGTRVWVRRFGRFVAVGLAATVVHGLVAWALVGSVSGYAANAVGFAVALSVTYIGNYFITFGAEGAHRETLVRFLVISAATLGVSEWILLFFQSMGADERVSVLVAVVAIPLLRFGVLATQVFDERRWTTVPLREWLVQVAVWTGAALVGIVALLAVAPDGFLDPDSAVWGHPAGDRGIGVAGMRYYLADDWHWPLLETDDLNVPDGANVAFTDSLPLLAVPAKVARPLLGDEVNYFPSWFWLTYTLQGIGAVALLRALKVRRPEALLAGAILAVTFPAFVFRSFHAALEGQFIVLLTLAAAFSSGGASPGGRRRARVLTVVGLAAALLIHPYLMFMTGPLVAGIYVDHHRRGRLSLRELLLTGTGLMATLVSILVVGGYLGTYDSDLDYGQYGLNLLSPAYPQLSGLLPGTEEVLAVGPSRWEGFNWLGFGALLVIASALFLERRRLVALVARWRGLSAAAALLTLVAVSHIITFGRTGLVDLTKTADWLRDRPQLLIVTAIAVLIAGFAALTVNPRAPTTSRGRRWVLALTAGPIVAATVVVWAAATRGNQILPLLSTVRASGRLWWSVGLLVTLSAVAIVGRSAARPLGFALLVLGAGLQIVDTGPIRQFARAAANETVDTPGIDELGDAIDQADIVRVSPSFFCAPNPDGSLSVLDAIVVASAVDRTPVDTVYTARRPVGLTCDDPPPTSVADDEVLVLVLPTKRDPGELLTPDYRCRDNTELLVCTRQWSNLPVAATAPFAPVVAEPVTFGNGGDAPTVTRAGWGEPEAWGQVIPPSGADLAIPLIGDTSGQLLNVRMRLRSTTGEPAELVAATPDGAEETYELIGTEPQNVWFTVPAPTSGTLELSLRSNPLLARAGIDELTVVLA